MSKNKAIWYLKQLLPLRYESTYTVSDPGKPDYREHCVWRMWFGRCFNVRREYV